jgi:hypothetical protein
MLRCRTLGHHYRFAADGRILCWHCERCGEHLGARRYADPETAARYARALDRELPAIGERAPPFALFPFRLARRGRRPT